MVGDGPVPTYVRVRDADEKTAKTINTRSRFAGYYDNIATLCFASVNDGQSASLRAPDSRFTKRIDVRYVLGSSRFGYRFESNAFHTAISGTLFHFPGEFSRHELRPSPRLHHPRMGR